MEQRTFDDPTIPAFLKATGKPFTITPQKNNTTGRVEFLVTGGCIDDALEELYSNAQIGSLDLIRELKSLRSAIFTLRGGVR